MAFSVIATGATRPVPDQLRIEYQLRDDGTVVDTGSVTMTFPFDPAWTAAQRRQRIREIFIACVRERVQGMRAASSDLAWVQSQIASGTIIVGEGD